MEIINNDDKINQNDIVVNNDISNIDEKNEKNEKNEKRKYITKSASIDELSKQLLLSVSDAARYSGLSYQTLRNIVKTNDCDFVVRIGDKIFFKRQKFEKFLLDNTNIVTQGEKANQKVAVKTIKQQ